MIQKILGYVISILGLLAIIASSGKAKEYLPFLENISSNYILIPGIVLVAIGVVLLFISNKSSSGKQLVEVPIFQGKGKKRTVVAYQRE